MEELNEKQYEKELLRLQTELVYLQEWVVAGGRRLVVLFEGRDTAGKDGAIKRIVYYLNPRTCRVVAVPTPGERERTQWFFQRYVAASARRRRNGAVQPQLVQPRRRRARDGLLQRGGVRRVPALLPAVRAGAAVNDGIMLVKYWLSVSDEEQERRFEKRLSDPRKRWKFSPTDLQARARWVDYAEAKDRMFAYTDIEYSPWYVVEADDKRTARLNLISHLLSLIPYEHITRQPEAAAAQDASTYAAQAHRAARAERYLVH